MTGKDKDYVPSKEERREGEYAPPGESISPGAHPEGLKPTEDPRKDSGLYPKDQPPTTKPVEPAEPKK